MGNSNSARQAGEVDVQVGGSLANGGSGEFMGQSPPRSPRSTAQSPLLFTPQVPMAPLQRLEETQSLSDSWMQNSADYENGFHDQGIPIVITWSFGGKEVLVEGSWDNWKTRKPLQRSGKEYSIMKVLPSGFYQYRFIVDGERRYAPDFPWTHDDTGNVYNILDVQEFVPESLESIASFEPPQSPESTYSSWPLGPEDLAKEPPVLPPQLNLTLLNTESTMDIPPPPPTRPPHVVLNHLYIQKGMSGHPVVALGETHRFMSKYVTVVLYKSLQS